MIIRKNFKVMSDIPINEILFSLSMSLKLSVSLRMKHQAIQEEILVFASLDMFQDSFTVN